MKTKPRRRPLPGSYNDIGDSNASLSSGRFTDAELTALGQVALWWTNRQQASPTSSLVTTLIAGVDDRGTCRTLGTTAGTVTFQHPLMPPGDPTGFSGLVHAFGIPVAFTGEIYSVVGLIHFYHDPAEGWMSRYTTIARTPTWVTSTEVRAVMSGPPPGDTPVIQMTGAPSVTIDWTVHLTKLEITPS